MTAPNKSETADGSHLEFRELSISPYLTQIMCTEFGMHMQDLQRSYSGTRWPKTQPEVNSRDVIEKVHWYPGTSVYNRYLNQFLYLAQQPDCLPTCRNVPKSVKVKIHDGCVWPCIVAMRAVYGRYLELRECQQLRISWIYLHQLGRKMCHGYTKRSRHQISKPCSDERRGEKQVDFSYEIVNRTQSSTTRLPTCRNVPNSLDVNVQNGEGRHIVFKKSISPELMNIFAPNLVKDASWLYRDDLLTNSRNRKLMCVTSAVESRNKSMSISGIIKIFELIHFNQCYCRSSEISPSRVFVLSNYAKPSNII